MRLLLKINLILILVFGVGAPATGYTLAQNFHSLDAVGEEVRTFKTLPIPPRPTTEMDLVIPDGCPDFEDGGAWGHEATVYVDWRT